MGTFIVNRHINLCSIIWSIFENLLFSFRIFVLYWS